MDIQDLRKKEKILRTFEIEPEQLLNSIGRFKREIDEMEKEIKRLKN